MHSSECCHLVDKMRKVNVIVHIPVNTEMRGMTNILLSIAKRKNGSLAIETTFA